MAGRLPSFAHGGSAVKTGFEVLEAELLGERASALGRMGRAAEAAMKALNETNYAPGSPERAALLDSAAYAVWCFFIQREVAGMRDHRDPIAVYGISKEVLARLGAGMGTRR